MINEKKRVILQNTDDPFLNMSIDRYIATLDYDIVVRMYYWSKPTLTIGYFQKADLFNRDLLEKTNTLFIRRITGGSSILHYNDLSFSIIIKKGCEGISGPKSLYTEVTNGVYRVLSGMIDDLVLSNNTENYRSVVSCAKASTTHEISKIDGSKITGAAVRVIGDKIILQSTIFNNNYNHTLVERFLKMPVTSFDTANTKTDINRIDEISNDKQVVNETDYNKDYGFDLLNLEMRLKDEFMRMFKIPCNLVLSVDALNVPIDIIESVSSNEWTNLR